MSPNTESYTESCHFSLLPIFSRHFPSDVGIGGKWRGTPENDGEWREVEGTLTGTPENDGEWRQVEGTLKGNDGEWRGMTVSWREIAHYVKGLASDGMTGRDEKRQGMMGNDGKLTGSRLIALDREIGSGQKHEP